MVSRERLKVIELKVWRERIRRTNDRLKSCPCCGGKAVIEENRKNDGYCSYYTLRVKCRECGLRTNSFISDGYYGEKHNPEEVAELWNRRMKED